MDRIRQLRTERGLSQAKLAVMAGMDPATLNRLEQGKGNPNLKTLQRLADALDIEVVDLLKKGATPPSQRSLFNGSEEERRSVAFAEAMIALADHWLAKVSDPGLDERKIAGIVDAALDLGDVIYDRIADLWNALPNDSRRMVIEVMEKTNEVGNHGLRRLDKDDAAEFERRRKLIRQRTQEISRRSAEIA